MKSRRYVDGSLIFRAALIVLPVALLSVIAFFGLREDKASIEKDARDRAEALAPDLAQALSERASETIKRARFAEGVISASQIVSPRDYSRVPVPADWPRQLTPAQAALWDTAQSSIFKAQDTSRARRALLALSASGAPAAAKSTAAFELLLLDARRGAAASAIAEQAAELARKYPEVPTESGAPVADVSLLLALQQFKSGRLPDVLVRELAAAVSQHPSFLTAEMLEAAERAGTDAETRQKVEALKANWLRQETTLALLRKLLPRSANSAQPSEVWVEADGQPWLALISPASGGSHVLLTPAGAIEQAFQSALRESPAQLPPYAAAAVEIAGRRWQIDASPNRPVPRGAVLLATAAGRLEGGSSHQFVLSLDLANPEMLFAGYRRRLWFAAALIFASFSAAVAGLISFWQGFVRQVRIAEMQSSFVSSVSHELRAPIAAVRLMAESLDRGKIADEAKKRDYFHLIAQECRRLSSLVENVLEFSRIDQGRKHYSFEPADLVALVCQTVALMAPCAAEKQVKLSLAEPPPSARDLRPCWDAHAVEQSLVNLLDNAIKHSPAGATVSVRIETPGEQVCVWVEDQGEGIPTEEQARIFDRFYRCGSELRRETQGAGIGLSIVKHVAEAHGGRVLVQSTVGQGSRFGLELPLAPPEVR